MSVPYVNNFKWRREPGLAYEGKGIGTGEDFEKITVDFKEAYLHYFVPLSRQRENPYFNFYSLVDKWVDETRLISSVTEKAIHPAYQEIIGMGWKAVPLILNELMSRPNHWFWALEAITGENPVNESQRGRIGEMVKAWVEWGKKKSII